MNKVDYNIVIFRPLFRSRFVERRGAARQGIIVSLLNKQRLFPVYRNRPQPLYCCNYVTSCILISRFCFLSLPLCFSHPCLPLRVLRVYCVLLSAIQIAVFVQRNRASFIAAISWVAQVCRCAVGLSKLSSRTLSAIKIRAFLSITGAKL